MDSPVPSAGHREGRLGGRVARRPLHFFWLLDCSGSMAADGKIQALDVSVREVIPALRDAADANPGVELFVRAVAFGSTLRQVVAEPTPIDQLRWPGVSVEKGGLTELGPALSWLAEQIRALAEVGRGFAPVVVLVSDGQPTDLHAPTFAEGLAMVRAQPWGERAVRRSIAVGTDANLEILRRFMEPSTDAPLRADNPDQLVAAIRFVSVAAVQASSVGRRAPESHRLGTVLDDPGSIVW